MTDSMPAQPRIVPAAAARRAATHMDIGNMVAMLAPLPLGILWLGASMLVYALHKHHPNPKVGQYTQWAAYRLYGVVGAVVPVATFFPGQGLTHWLVCWAVAAAVIIPWSIWSLVRIRRDHWEDIVLPAEEPADA
jgi:hypothetical protein